jgi:hypothetical protein
MSANALFRWAYIGVHDLVDDIDYVRQRSGSNPQGHAEGKRPPPPSEILSL